MKRVSIITVLLLIFLLGIICGTSDAGNQDLTLKYELAEFEEQITNPNNNYQPNIQIEENRVGQIGQIGEEIVDKIFGFSFSIIKKIIND